MNDKTYRTNQRNDIKIQLKYFTVSIGIHQRQNELPQVCPQQLMSRLVEMARS